MNLTASATRPRLCPERRTSWTYPSRVATNSSTSCWYATVCFAAAAAVAWRSVAFARVDQRPGGGVECGDCSGRRGLLVRGEFGHEHVESAIELIRRTIDYGKGSGDDIVCADIVRRL